LWREGSGRVCGGYVLLVEVVPMKEQCIILGHVCEALRCGRSSVWSVTDVVCRRELAHTTRVNNGCRPFGLVK
jgi:hypothetical protein